MGGKIPLGKSEKSDHLCTCDAISRANRTIEENGSITEADCSAGKNPIYFRNKGNPLYFISERGPIDHLVEAVLDDCVDVCYSEYG